jgi:hypothetical protein
VSMRVHVCLSGRLSGPSDGVAGEAFVLTLKGDQQTALPHLFLAGSWLPMTLYLYSSDSSSYLSLGIFPPIFIVRLGACLVVSSPELWSSPFLFKNLPYRPPAQQSSEPC